MVRILSWMGCANPVLMASALETQGINSIDELVDLTAEEKVTAPSANAAILLRPPPEGNA